MDQAEGLRELAKAGAFEQVGLPAVFDRAPGVDKAKLWDDLKELLEHQIKSNAFPGVDVFGKSTAEDVLIYMLRAEVVAHHMRPANDTDFASVGATLKGDRRD